MPLGLTLGEDTIIHLPESPGQNLQVVLKPPVTVPTVTTSQGAAHPLALSNLLPLASARPPPPRLGISLPLRIAPLHPAVRTILIQRRRDGQFPAQCPPWLLLASSETVTVTAQS